MEQIIYGMIQRFFLASVCILVYVKRQAGYGFRQDSDAGVYRGGLHGGSFIDSFTAIGSAKEETVGAAVESVLGAGSGV